MVQVRPQTTIVRMDNLLSQWQSVQDARSVFLSCYRMMTLNMLKAIEQQEFHDSDWVDRLLNHFAGYYFNALEACENDQPGAPDIWRGVFQAARQPDTHVLQHLLLGVNAHINYDLIFALVDILQPEWLNLTQEERAWRYADHRYVNEVIYRTVDAVQDNILEPHQPVMDVIDRLLGRVDEWAVSSVIRVWRDQVWQDAVALLETADLEERRRLSRSAEIEALRRSQIILKLI